MTDYLDPDPSGRADRQSSTSTSTSTTALRLFCFPHAGGGSAPYRRWQACLGPQVAVCPVYLPGRERRIRHPRFVDMAAQVADLDAELGPHLDGPHLFFGHSMGALIAYRLAMRRRAVGACLPSALLLSSAPRAGAARLPPPTDTTEAGLARLLVDLGGLPREVLGRPDWLDLLLPVIRDDLLLCASDAGRGAGGPSLPVPFHLFGGHDDPIVTPADLAGWGRHSAAGVELTLFPGGHFYLRDDPTPFLAALRTTVGRYAAARPTAASGTTASGTAASSTSGAAASSTAADAPPAGAPRAACPTRTAA
jgi:surfactin synthase thioesterase subunit